MRSKFLQVAALICAGVLAGSASADVRILPSPLQPSGLDERAAAPGILLSLEAQSYQDFKHGDEQFVLTGFALPDGRTVALEVTRFDVYAHDARLVVVAGGVERETPRPDQVFLRGVVQGIADSSVFLSLSPMGSNGFIRIGERMLLLSDDPAPDNPTALLFDTRDLPAGVFKLHDFACGTPDLPRGGRVADGAQESVSTLTSEEERVAPPCRIVQIAFESDFEYFNIFGNATVAQAYMGTLIGAVGEIYRRDLNTNFEITFSRVFSDPGDPYFSSGVNDRLPEFASVWFNTMSGVNRDIAHMLTGWCGPAGGIAYLGVLCNSGSGFSVSGCLAGGFPYPLVHNDPGNWDVVVCAHELGHNFNAIHTHEMSPPVDGCGATPQNCAGANQGTIMSYCHTCSPGMSNIRLEFGAPVKAIINSYLNGGAGGCIAQLTGVDYPIPPASRAVRQGQSTTMTSIPSGTPPITNQWRRDGVNLSNGGGISGVTTTNLTINPVQFSHFGAYDIQGTNPCSINASPAAQLDVLCGTPAPGATKLVATGSAADDRVGSAVTLSGHILVSGAPRDDDLGADAGAAYPRERIGGSWTQLPTLFASDGTAGDQFGRSVAAAGDFIVVGAPNDDDHGADSGAAYVFQKVSGAWTEVAKLSPADGAAGDHFGLSVAINGTSILVGAPDDGDVGAASGSVYPYHLVTGTWTAASKLNSTDAAAGDRFGTSVSIDGNSAVIGAPGDNSNAGSAYIFTRPSEGAWVQSQKLTASDAAASDGFGQSGSIAPGLIAIGAPGNDDAGESSGSAYVFLLGGGTWTQAAKLTASDAAAGDALGASVAVAMDTVIAGAAGNDDAGESSGSVYAFQPVSGVWGQLTKLTAADAALGDQYGCAVASGGSRTVIGAAFDDDAGSDGGSAYIVNLYPNQPNIIKAPVETFVFPDNIATMTVDASAEGSLGYQWKRNGVNLTNSGRFSGVNTPTLTINTAQVGDDGLYSVAVTGSCGAIQSQSAMLWVVVTASITHQPSGNTVCAGISQIFSVMATGNPPPTYQWRRNNVNLNDGVNIVGSKSPTMVVNPVTSGDSGAYDCVVSNFGGTVTSDTATLNVAGFLTLDSHPSSIAACNGQVVGMSVSATSDTNIQYRWRRNGLNLVNGSDYAGVTTPNLIISVTPPIAGVFDCLVSNNCGNIPSDPASLTVDSPASITLHPNNADVCDSGGVAVFQVAATGSGTLSYQWRKGFQNLSNGGNISGVNTPTLTVSPALQADAGDYDCVVMSGGCTTPSSIANILFWPAGGGDANYDFVIDEFDIDPFVQELLVGGADIGSHCNMDMNLDGLVDSRDLAMFIDLLAS